MLNTRRSLRSRARSSMTTFHLTLRLISQVSATQIAAPRPHAMALPGAAAALDQSATRPPLLCRLMIEPIELHPDVRGLGRGVGERDRFGESSARLVATAEVLEECATQPVEIEIARERPGQRLDQLERFTGS